MSVFLFNKVVASTYTYFRSFSMFRKAHGRMLQFLVSEDLMTFQQQQKIIKETRSLKKNDSTESHEAKPWYFV